MSLLRNVLTYMGLGPDEDYDDGYRYDADDARGSDDVRVESDERSAADPHAPRERPRSMEPQRAAAPAARAGGVTRDAAVPRQESPRPGPPAGSQQAGAQAGSQQAGAKPSAKAGAKAGSKRAESTPDPKQAGSQQRGSQDTGSPKAGSQLADPKGAGSREGSAAGAAKGGAAGAGAGATGGPALVDLRTKGGQSRPLRAVPPAEMGIQTDLVQPENGLTVRAVTAEAEMASDSAAVGSVPRGRRQVPPRILSPTSFGDAKTLADDFMNAVPVVMNLRGVERDLSRRLIDFASGICYALEGTMEKMAPQVFLLSPRSVEVSPDDRRRLAQRNYES